MVVLGLTDLDYSPGRAELNFVVCQLDSQYWQVWLQTGSATPGGTCSNYQTLHLPCLC